MAQVGRKALVSVASLLAVLADGPRTQKQLAVSLGVSVPVVGTALRAALEAGSVRMADALVQYTSVDGKAGKGRPARAYQLTPATDAE